MFTFSDFSLLNFCYHYDSNLLHKYLKNKAITNGDKIRVNKKIKRCSFCGNSMEYHVYDERVYWVCPNCKNGFMTSKNAELLAGNIIL